MMDSVLLSILCVVGINFLLSVMFFYMLWLVCKKMTLIEKEILVLSMMEEARNPTSQVLSPPMTPKQDDDFYIDYNISNGSNDDLIPENIIKLDELHKMNVSEDQNDLRIRY